MKKEQLEQWLLLQDSGELADAQQQELEQLLGSDPEARRHADSFIKLLDAACSTESTDEPGVWVVQRILHEAKHHQHSEHRNRMAFPGFAFRPAFAAAAAAVLLLSLGFGLLNLNRGQETEVARDTPEETFDFTQELLASVLDDMDAQLSSIDASLDSLEGGLEGENFWESLNSNGSLSEEDIAAELLELEGISI